MNYSLSPSPRMVWLASLGFAAAVGALVAVSPVVGVGIGAGAGLVALLALRERFLALFLGLLVALLVGYAFLGKTFAYLGVGPVFVGEIVLGLALISFLAVRRRLDLRPIHWVLLVFMAWGALCTAPYLEQYGVTALRDAVVWGYAIFALALWNALDARHLQRAVTLYRRFIPAFTIWVPIAGVLFYLAGGTFPNLPGTTISLLSFKGGDAGVHLAGVGAFLVVGLFADARALSRMREALTLILWFASFAAAGAVSRGGLLAASTAWAAAAFFRPSRGLLLGLAASTVMITVVAAADLAVVGSKVRQISLDQLQANIVSVFSSGDDLPSGLEATKDFRLNWWTEIVDYTINGPYFWTGKGFGINLADDDGFQVTSDGSLRSPHNSHVTILARMGVPGLLLWIGLQLAFAWGLISAFFRAKSTGAIFWARVNVWILVYWLACLVNMSFDVYLEGPQGGIWFWVIVGVGLAALRIQRDPAVMRRAQPLPAAPLI